ncbi:glycosyltransferase family 4 protein [Arthrobacter sp. NPDC056493]|uniref:glycosyltransferase family 4 protein n=1 Tax=Arthrobacter sp. NPDC056493 TaxID=3345839 RepID=UPI00367335AF
MPTANIVYWYGLKDMPRDGGGLRAIAWNDALTELGFKTSVHALRSVALGPSSKNLLRAIKKQLIPMPLASSLPLMAPADLNVVTVPAVFSSAVSMLDQSSLVFDWMDLWSVNALTMGRSSWMSRPGGIIQSKVWARRQRALVTRPAANIFAGYEDHESTEVTGSAPGFWIPTPISAAQRAWPQPTRAVRRVGFIGNFVYPPNVMSLKDFFDKYGRIFLDKGIEIYVAGFGSEVVTTWGVNATVLGKVESLAAFYGSIDAVIVPIDHGGGIKAKAVEAMAYGIPVYGTSHVASGFSPEWRRFIGDIDDLLRTGAITIPTPSKQEFSTIFSQAAFTAAVARVVDLVKPNV